MLGRDSIKCLSRIVRFKIDFSCRVSILKEGANGLLRRDVYSEE